MMDAPAEHGNSGLGSADSPEVKPVAAHARSDHPWHKSPAFWVSVAALLISSWSAYNSTRSANASVLSASAALTNADWASYQRNPHHELIARVLKTGFLVARSSSGNTNGEAFFDLALINNGNQSEIVRRVTLNYLESENSPYGPITWRDLNSQLARGEKQVLRMTLEHGLVFTAKDVWLRVGVTAIGPDAEDIESTFPVAKFTLAVDGNGGSYSPLFTNSTTIVSDKRLTTQHPVPFTGY